MFSGPVDIAPQDTQWVMAALIVSTGNDYRDAIVNLKLKAETLQILPYDQLVTKTSLLPIPETPPDDFYLSQNYPNPFNSSTKIKYNIPLVGTRDRVSVQIIVYDILGNKVATLVNEEKSPGKYEVEFSPETSIKYPASGVYFYQLKAGPFIQTKKMILLK
jgi:hypothetical protein